MAPGMAGPMGMTENGSQFRDDGGASHHSPSVREPRSRQAHRDQSSRWDRTVTESDDPQIAQLLKTHVADMMKRVAAGDDPGLPIESEALHTIFRDKDKVHISVEATASGVVVVQTSDDAKAVAALQEHAAQVSDFAAEGMRAVHTAMMKKMGGAMQGGMIGPGMHGMMGGGMMRHPM